MISETFFAAQYRSVWRSVAPSLENFVRSRNLDGYERVWTPIKSDTKPSRRGIINEAAFLIFKTSNKHHSRGDGDFTKNAVATAFANSASYVLKKRCTDNDKKYSSLEEAEALELAARIRFFFTHIEKRTDLTISPQFQGSGLISPCFGDAAANDRLYEFKSGDRNFRSIDYRQLAIYLALNYAAKGQTFASLFLLNPRTGIYVEVSSEQFAFEVSGQSTSTFCQSLIECFSAHLISE